MFCSCRISTDKRVARSLCHSRASCSYCANNVRNAETRRLLYVFFCFFWWFFWSSRSIVRLAAHGAGRWMRSTVDDGRSICSWQYGATSSDVALKVFSTTDLWRCLWHSVKNRTTVTTCISISCRTQRVTINDSAHHQRVPYVSDSLRWRAEISGCRAVSAVGLSCCCWDKAPSPSLSRDISPSLSLSLSLSLRLSALIYSYSGRRCAQLHARPQISWPMISLSISQEIGCWEDRLRNGGKRVGC